MRPILGNVREKRKFLCRRNTKVFQAFPSRRRCSQSRRATNPRTVSSAACGWNRRNQRKAPKRRPILLLRRRSLMLNLAKCQCRYFAPKPREKGRRIGQGGAQGPVMSAELWDLRDIPQGEKLRGEITALPLSSSASHSSFGGHCFRSSEAAVHT